MPAEFERIWDLRKPANCKKPEHDDRVPFKHCHLIFTIDGEAEAKIIPFTALMTLEKASNTNLAFNATKLALLTDPSGNFCVCDPQKQDIIYEFHSANGWAEV